MDTSPIHFKSDCRHFLGDRPCLPHKKEGVRCDNCPYYQPTQRKILIIKLGAVGDVLRTTGILPALQKKYPDSYVVWITRGGASDLLKNNPYLDLVVEYPYPAMNRLLIERYDLVINLDSDFEGASLATLAKADKKFGYGCAEDGRVYPFNPNALPWLEMALRDDLKKANQRTYQEIMLEICELPKGSPMKPILGLTPKEAEFARMFAERHSIEKGDLVIGMNTGASSRWKYKKWTLEGFQRLIQLVSDKYQAKILLLGGPSEAERNKYLMRNSSGNVIDGGAQNTLRQFAALIDLCQLVVVGDTLALHMAVAMDKKVVGLFGPTSQTEIDLFGKGVKVSADLDCLCCYLADCDKKINCMDSLAAEKVFAALESLMVKESCCV